jgi:hypothetical protein
MTGLLPSPARHARFALSNRRSAAPESRHSLSSAARSACWREITGRSYGRISSDPTVLRIIME